VKLEECSAELQAVLARAEEGQTGVRAARGFGRHNSALYRAELRGNVVTFYTLDFGGSREWEPRGEPTVMAWLVHSGDPVGPKREIPEPAEESDRKGAFYWLGLAMRLPVFCLIALASHVFVLTIYLLASVLVMLIYALCPVWWLAGAPFVLLVAAFRNDAAGWEAYRHALPEWIASIDLPWRHYPDLAMPALRTWLREGGPFPQDPWF
jgi:hypothetical protein